MCLDYRLEGSDHSNPFGLRGVNSVAGDRTAKLQHPLGQLELKKLVVRHSLIREVVAEGRYVRRVRSKSPLSAVLHQERRRRFLQAELLGFDLGLSFALLPAYVFLNLGVVTELYVKDLWTLKHPWTEGRQVSCGRSSNSAD